MIRIGLTGWGDHDDLYRDGISGRKKLKRYSQHFSVVEVDSSFYAIQSTNSYQKWAEETPPEFSFVIKAYQGMTGHLRGKNPYPSVDEMFQSFIASIQPVIEACKLKAILFQFPPWFDCTKANVDTLKVVKSKMGNLPVALEFRHQSWFIPKLRDKTLAFMQREGWIHSICDEPQAGEGSVPIILHSTVEDLTIVRFHGRNVQGWSSTGNANWREVRYLYHYSRQELAEWAERLGKLSKDTKEIIVLFNNNSGGHAVSNAMDLMDLLGIEYLELNQHPDQLELF